MARAPRWFLPIVIVLGAACSERMPSQPLVGTSPAASECSAVPTDSSLAAHRARWAHSGVYAYRYRFRWSCFCVPERVRTVVITVVGGKIVSVVDAATSLPLGPEDVARYRTIDGLFDFIRESMDYPADQVRVSFEPALGFPSSACVDYRATIADEELGFSIDRWVRI